MLNNERVVSFIEGINVFGYRLVKEKDYKEARNSIVERMKLITERDKLSFRNSHLETQMEELKAKEHKLPFSIDVGDPVPSKAGERKTYVAEVAGFHKSHLHNKLIHLIHSIHLLFEDEANRVNQDRMLKGAVYAFRELDRWGNAMISERMSNEGENISAPDSETLEDNLKT